MSLPHASAPANFWSPTWSGVAKWFEGWWHVDTLGPDLLVGLATGAVVGLIVMRAERRISARTRAREVADAQTTAVERGQRALLLEIRFLGDKYQRLHLDRSLLERIVVDVDKVPSGQPAEHVPGYHWLQRLAGAATDLESFADALDVRVKDHDRTADNTGLLAIWININIAEHSDLTPEQANHWSWRWHESPIPAQIYKTKVEKDDELEVLIFHYAKQRRLVRAYREAFLEAMSYLRGEESDAILARARVRGGRIRQARAHKAAQQRIRNSRAWADLQGIEIVSKVDPKAV